MIGRLVIGRLVVVVMIGGGDDDKWRWLVVIMVGWLVGVGVMVRVGEGRKKPYAKSEQKLSFMSTSFFF